MIPPPGHRAIVIAVDGKIVDEWYADGFDKDTPFLSWSMAKSIIATLIGAAELKGVVNIDAPPPIPEWSENDTRTAISWRDLLQMQSGLAFAEEYASARSDVNQMLFERADSGQFAARSPAAASPGDVWQYSSGTSNIYRAPSPRRCARKMPAFSTLRTQISFTRSAPPAPLWSRMPPARRSLPLSFTRRPATGPGSDSFIFKMASGAMNASS